MMQSPIVNNATPFSYKAFVEIYQKLDFSKRSQALKLFLTQDAALPKKNPPYLSSIFPERANQIITIISYLLAHYYDQMVDEAIIGLLSNFSNDAKPLIVFNFSHFLVESIHQKLVKFPTYEVFKYASILVYMFLYFQGDKMNFSLQKLDETGNQQWVNLWTTLVMK